MADAAPNPVLLAMLGIVHITKQICYSCNIKHRVLVNNWQQSFQMGHISKLYIVI